MNKLNLVIYFLLALLVAFGLSFYFHQRIPETIVTDPGLEAVPEEPVKRPVVRYPVPDLAPEAAAPVAAPAEQEQTITAETEDQVGSELPEELPAIEHSDTFVDQAMKKLFGGRNINDLVIIDNFVQRLVLTINNLPEKKLPLAHVPFKLPEGKFLVIGEGEELLISPENHQRYAPYIYLLENVNPDLMIKIYVQLYPLLQTAYQQLGYTNAYFNDRLVYVIEHLLETPNPEDSLALEQPAVLYTYAESALEQRSAGQKILLRLGKDQRTRTLSILRNYHFRLTRLLP